MSLAIGVDAEEEELPEEEESVVAWEELGVVVRCEGGSDEGADGGDDFCM